jgi:hypothetical protein
MYSPGDDGEQPRAEAARIDAAVAKLAAAGVAISYLQAIAIPREETVFHLFEAADSAVVQRALQEAGLEPDRISLAIAAWSDKQAAGRERET